MGTKVSLVTFVLVILGATVVVAGSTPKVRGERAFAEFEIDHGNNCTVTTALVFVFDNRAYKPGDSEENKPRVEVFYNVFGQPTHPGCDGLFTYELHGTAPLQTSDFSTSPGNLKDAVLTISLEVFDEESGSAFDVALSVVWVATGPLIDNHQ